MQVVQQGSIKVCYKW